MNETINQLLDKLKELYTEQNELERKIRQCKQEMQDLASNMKSETLFGNKINSMK